MLSEEEMEERRRQMMADAKVNNKERSGNVRRYKEEEKREIMEVCGHLYLGPFSWSRLCHLFPMISTRSTRLGIKLVIFPIRRSQISFAR